MSKNHDRRLGISGVAQTGARNNRYETQALTAVRDELEAVLDQEAFLNGASFSWVTVAVRYGIVDSDEPIYQTISKKYGDLPLSIEVNTENLIGSDLPTLTYIFRKAVLKALVHAAKKYNRPSGRLEAMLTEENQSGD